MLLPATLCGERYGSEWESLQDLRSDPCLEQAPRVVSAWRAREKAS